MKAVATKRQPKLKTLSIDIETDMKGNEIYAISLYSKDYKKALINNPVRSKDKKYTEINKIKEIKSVKSIVLLSHQGDYISE